MRLKAFIVLSMVGFLLAGAGCIPQLATPREKFIASLSTCDAAQRFNGVARPDEQSLGEFLGINATVLASHDLNVICYDEAHNTIGLILAQQTESPCIDACDEVLFGAYDLNVLPEQAEKGFIKGNLKKSEHQLGIYNEAYNSSCFFDQVIPLANDGSDFELLFYCGTGEWGGFSTWYQYLQEADELNIVQSPMLIEEHLYEFDVYGVHRQRVLDRFNYKSNAEMTPNTTE